MTSLRNSSSANQILAEFKHAQCYTHIEDPNHKISRELTYNNKNKRIRNRQIHKLITQFTDKFHFVSFLCKATVVEFTYGVQTSY